MVRSNSARAQIAKGVRCMLCRTLENLEMSERKGIIFPLQFSSLWGMLFPQPDHKGQTVSGTG
jgi:hypothetical protein